MTLNAQTVSEIVDATKSIFQENIGQVSDTDVLYLGQAPGFLIGFSRSKIIIRSTESRSSIIITFNNSNNITPKGHDIINYCTNYFLGERGTYTNVKGFSKIFYPNLWDGIDLEYTFAPSGLKYEFIVHKGVDPSKIVVHCSGQQSLSLESGNLEFHLEDSTIIDTGLVGYQESKEVPVDFKLISDNLFSYAIGDYDPNGILHIDPLLYSSFVGGNGDDESQSIVRDNEGNCYVTGSTGSVTFPFVTGYNDTLLGGLDCFVFKINPVTNELIYSTFVGGSSDDAGMAIDIDDEGNVYVTGNTESIDFPTVESYDDSYEDNGDSIIFKLNSTGNGLDYSTYFGGWSNDYGESIKVDSSHNAWVLITTGCWELPVMESSFDSTEGSGWDCYMFKLNATGGLDYSTYLSTDADEKAFDLEIDQYEDIYVLGQVDGHFFSTSGAYDNTSNGMDDIYVMKFNSTGNGLKWCTLVGGSHWDWPRDMEVDSYGNVYVATITWSTNFPEVNAYDAGIDHGAPNTFIDTVAAFKLAANGSSLIYSTYIGTGTVGRGDCLAVDEYGHAFLTGHSRSNNFPKVNHIQSRAGGDDCIVFRLHAQGNQLYYSTFVGGIEHDKGNSLVLDETGTTYVVGTTESATFPMVDAYNSTYGGGLDTFFFLLSDLGDTIGPNISVTHTPQVPNDTQHILVTVNVSDPTGVLDVILSYQVDEEGWTNLTMNNYGLTWNATIPAQSEDTTVSYKVYAVDSRENWAETSESSFTVTNPISTTTTSTTTTTTTADITTTTTTTAESTETTTSTTTPSSPTTTFGLDTGMLIVIGGAAGVVIIIIGIIVMKRK